MIKTGTISYYRSHEIDKSKWDNCIEFSDNGLIYARSYYLDNMAHNWDALVLDDYEAVMPLTWNRKFGFYYLYQPYFVPALGLFGKKVSGQMVLAFLNAIPRKFKYWNIDLNESNKLINISMPLQINLSSRVNYHLNLNKSYEELYAGYQKPCRRRLRRAGQQEVETSMGGEPAEVVNFYRSHYESKYPKISPAVYESLLESATSCFKKDMAKTYFAKLPCGEITAAYLVLQDKNFVYLLMGGSSKKGKETGSFYSITDAIIRHHAGSERTLRFEGSDITGIALFNAQFGATISQYLHLNRNNLPFPVNLLK